MFSQPRVLGKPVGFVALNALKDARGESLIGGPEFWPDPRRSPVLAKKLGVSQGSRAPVIGLCYRPETAKRRKVAVQSDWPDRVFPH